MLGKLSIRNAKRQAKDYIIYFITVVISVALMFSFNAIAVSEDKRFIFNDGKLCKGNFSN